MSNYTEQGVTFKNPSAIIYTGGYKLSRAPYKIDANTGNIVAAQKVINAIDIDWNNVIVPGLNNSQSITSTALLLKLIGEMNMSITKHYVMTTEEYNALEEKDLNGIYFITDGNNDVPIIPDDDNEYSINNPEQIETSIFINGDEHNESNIVLTPGEKYVLSGKLNGNILIDATNADINSLENTELVLNNVTIINNNSNYGIKYNTPDVKGYKDLIITIAPNSINYVLCTNEVEVADDQPGAIYSTNNLTIQGSGYLACYNLGGHGIRGSELKLFGPHIYVHSSHDAIHAKKMWICGGTYYINQANDAFGTGIGGTIWYAYGHIYLNALNGKSFNAKSGTVNNVEKTGNIYYIEELDIYSQTIYEKSENITSIQDLYAGITFIKEYTSSDAAKISSSSGTDVNIENNMYVITKPFVTISGTIDKPIYIPSILTNVTIFLNNVLINTAEINNVNHPSIYYESTASNVKIFSLQDTVNAIINNCNNINNDGDADAIKSEHNLKMEMKNDSYIYVSALIGDGLDGTDVNITDSKGALLIHNCGERGIKGTHIIIGPSASTPNGILTLIDNPMNVPAGETYTTFDGALIAIENCKEFSTERPSIVANQIASSTGYADIFARKGKKIDKGSLYVTNNELKGVVICNSIGSIIESSLDNADNFYYNSDYSYSNSIQTNIPEANVERYIAIGYKNKNIS